MSVERVTLAGIVAIAAFLWSLHRDMHALGERVARLEGLIEGLRDAVTARNERPARSPPARG